MSTKPVKGFVFAILFLGFLENLNAQPLEDVIYLKSKVIRGYLGVFVQPLSEEMAETAGMLNDHGALVSGIPEDGPAALSSLQEGDIIVGLNGDEVIDSDSFQRRMAVIPPGATVELDVLRYDGSAKVDVTLGEMPPRYGSIIRGMIIEQVPNVSLKIQTRDGSILVFEINDIERITKEPSVAVKPDSGKRKEHRRAGWVVGFSGGPGAGNFPNESSKIGAIGNFRVGRMVHPKLLIHIESQVYVREEIISNVKVETNFGNSTIAGTLYPGDPTQPSGGFYLRGGIGAANGDFNGSILGTKFQLQYRGWGVLVGLGYEFRLARRFALGVGAGYNKMFFEPELSTNLDVQFSQFVLDFNWYL